MEITEALRLVVLYAHLLVSVFALQQVLSADFKVLRHQLQARDLVLVHGRVVWLLGGLWITGLLLAGIDLQFDAALLAAKPKLAAKLITVVVLTLNGILLRWWCFPRLTSRRRMTAFESSLVMALGAASTASWLMAAFFGIAKPLQHWPLGSLLVLYVAVLAAAVAVSQVLSLRMRGPVQAERSPLKTAM